MNAQRLFTILAALVVCAPVGAATWYGYGTYEPDTIYDYESGWVPKDAPQDPNADKLYFNVWPGEYIVTMNPNAGALGSRVLVAPLRHYQAMLGVWADCNGDQTVGMAETAVGTYRAELLLDDSICPVGSAHNDGQWVWEYIAVGYQEEDTPNMHEVQIVDQDARVWGDFGLPGAGPAGTCPIAPLPHGTTAGTGWMIRYADCFTARQITGAVNDADPDGSLGLRFDDQNNPQYSDSLLNQHLPESLFGNPATGETGFLQLDSEEDGGDEDAAFTTWDCAGPRTGVTDPTGLAPQTISVDDPTYDGETGAIGGNYGKFDENLTDDGYYAWVATPAPAAGNPLGSYADGVNNTFRGVHTGGNMDYDTSANGGTCEDGNDQSGDNTYSDWHQFAFFYADGNHEGNTQVAGKNKADISFGYDNSGEADGALAQHLGTSMPGQLGTRPGWNDQGWSAGVVYVTTPQSINRATMQPQPGLYMTFYAKVGAATLAAYDEPAGSAFYGSEACGEAVIGIVNGWECDSAKWYVDSNGVDISDPLVDVRVHEVYQFRDIDCDDGTLVRGQPVHASLVDISERGPCADAPIE